MKRFFGVLSFFALALVACAIAFNPARSQTTGGGIPADIIGRSLSDGLTRTGTAYTDRNAYPITVLKNQNSRAEIQVVNYNTGNASRAGIVVGVEGQGAIALRGTSNSYITGVANGPNGAQGLINTGTTVPMVFATNDTLRLFIDGNGGDTTLSTVLRLANGSTTAPAYTFANATGVSAGTGIYSAAAGYIDFTSRQNTNLEIGPTYVAMQGTAQFMLLDGSAATPAATFINNSNDGLYRVGPHDIGVSINGTKVADFKSTGIDNLGQTIPHFAHAKITVTPATSCAVTNGLAVSACSFVGVGIYDLTLTGFSAVPHCTVTIDDTATFTSTIATIRSGSSTSSNIRVALAVSGAAFDNSFDVICLGV